MALALVSLPAGELNSIGVHVGHSRGQRARRAPSSGSGRHCGQIQILRKLECPAILPAPPSSLELLPATFGGSQHVCAHLRVVVTAKKGAGGNAKQKSPPRSSRALPIRLIHVSKGQSTGAKLLTQEYAEKLFRYCEFEEVQIRPNPKNVSDADLQVEHEAERVGRVLKPRDWVIALDERGRTVTSEQLADLIADAGDSGWLGLVFCIGGPYGHGAEIIARANDKIQLSSLVLNHEIARVVLMEQLYRAWTILRGENYHH